MVRQIRVEFEEADLLHLRFELEDVLIEVALGLADVTAEAALEAGDVVLFASMRLGPARRPRLSAINGQGSVRAQAQSERRSASRLTRSCSATRCRTLWSGTATRWCVGKSVSRIT